ncbi:MAG: GIY-YIG nuclease family protein, partial [Sphingobacteriales bacterium]
MAKDNKLTKDDHDLLHELGIEIDAKKSVTHTPREERIIAGFEEIQTFVDKHGRLPEHGEEKDIFERLYAVRLDQIRSQEECRNLLKDLDRQNLLNGDYKTIIDISDEMNDEELLAQLGVDDQKEDSITNLK